MCEGERSKQNGEATGSGDKKGVGFLVLRATVTVHSNGK